LLTPILVASELVSVALALFLVFSFLRAYLLRRSVHLLGLPIGFSLLALSYYSLGMSLLYEDNVAISEPFMWLRFVTQSAGFVLVGLAYYFSSRATNMEEAPGERVSGSLVLFVSVTSILLLIGFLVVLHLFLGLPSVGCVDECFTVVNLIVLGYVVYHLVKHLMLFLGKTAGLVWAPTAFSIMWLGQYSLLIWDIDGSETALVLAHAARLAALILLIRIYWIGETYGESRETQ
jgi:hypothetical protein